MLHAKYECSSPCGLSQEDFKGFPLFPCKIGCTLAEPKYDHRNIIFTILVTDLQILLQTKYKCSNHYGLSEEDFKRFPSLILCKIVCAQAEPKYHPKGIILTIFIKGHKMMLHAKYECSSPYGLSQEDFKGFPLFPCKIGCTLPEPKYDHRNTIFTILVEDHQIMLQNKYECSNYYGLSSEDFLKISFFVIM